MALSEPDEVMGPHREYQQLRDFVAWIAQTANSNTDY